MPTGFAPQAFAAALTPKNRKPLRWPFDPALTKYPAVWNEAKVCLPLWDISPGGTGDTKTFDIAAKVLRTVPLSDSDWSSVITPQGLAVNSQAQTAETQIDIDNFLGGVSQFTILAVMRCESGAVDQTIVGRWNTNSTIIWHLNSSNANVWFHLDHGGSSGGASANSSFEFNVIQAHACRLSPDGAMDIFVDGVKQNIVAAGTPKTVSTGAPKLGFMGDDAGGTNDAFDGDGLFLFGTTKALSDGFIQEWSRDWSSLIRPDINKAMPTFETVVAGGGLSIPVAMHQYARLRA